MIDIINIGMDIGLLGILLASAVLILRSGNLLAITLLSTVYSLSICALFVIMDAVDVAFTEAAVGAGIFTVLILAVIKHKDESLAPRWPSAISIVLGLGLGVLLIVGTLDMSMYGNPLAPAHLHLAPRFLGQSGTETGIPNVVTSVLASYRGYDTLGEVVVIFTAGLAVLLLLSPATTSTGRQLENQQNQSLAACNQSDPEDCSVTRHPSGFVVRPVCTVSWRLWSWRWIPGRCDFWRRVYYLRPVMRLEKVAGRIERALDYHRHGSRYVDLCRDRVSGNVAWWKFP